MPGSSRSVLDFVTRGAAAVPLSLALSALCPAALAQQPSPQPSASAPSPPPPLPEPASDAYRQHMDVGISLYEQKNYAAAITEFEEAYKARPKASPLVNVALCHKAMFAYHKAVRALETALAKHEDTMDENDKKAARTEIEEMRALLSYVTFEVTPPRFSVRVDGESYAEAAQGKEVELSPGPHDIQITAEGYAPVEQRVSLVSGKRTLRYSLQANMGFVTIKAAGPTYAIAVDQKALDYGQWSGLLAPGPHVIEMYIPGSPAAPYRVRLDVEVGQTYEVSPGKGGVPILGAGPAVPRPPPRPPAPPAPPFKGPFFLATVSVFAPTEHPAAFNGEAPSPGASVGVRGGYRVNTPVSFDAMVEYSNVLVSKSTDQDISYNLEMVRAGLNMRLQTPGKTARFYGNFGGGYVWESLDFDYGPGQLVACLTPKTTLPGVAPTCADIDGSDGYFLIEGGLQLTLGGVLVDAGVGTFIQSTRGFGTGRYKDWLPVFEAGLRVGYGFW